MYSARRMECRTRLLVYFVLTNLDFPYSRISQQIDAHKYPEHRPAGLNYHLRAVELTPVVQSIDGYKKDAERSTHESSRARSDDDSSYQRQHGEKYFRKQTTDTADSVTELILNFRDPITDYPIVPDFSLNSYGNEAKVTCSTKRCLGCMQKLFDKLKSTQSIQDKTHREMRFLSRELDLDHSDYRSYCKHFDAKASDFFNCKPTLISEEDVHEVNNYLKGHMLSCPVHNGKKLPKPAYGNSQDIDSDRRWLRSSYSRDRPTGRTVQGLIFLSPFAIQRFQSAAGHSAQISCNYRRGEPQDQPGSDTGLCDMCWSLMTLPDSFSPRFINQLMCNPSDDSCLSGYGTCRARYRHISVWYSNRTVDMQSAVVYVPVACECQVPYSSILRNLVVGTSASVSVVA
ncbi:hypothetical protein D918_03304 [Trichuris suis]|nr:hypothetical protein D918_03304 [Trichuris suis]